MKNERLQRILDNNLKALKTAAENGDVKTTKYLLDSINGLTAIYTAADIFYGLTDALTAASKKKDNKRIITLLATAIAEENARLEAEKSDEDAESADFDEELEGVDFKAVFNMAGSAVKFVFDEDTRGESSEEFKENAKSFGNSIKKLFGRAKTVVITATSKENLDAASEKINKITEEAVEKIRKIGEDMMTKFEEVDIPEQCETVDEETIDDTVPVEDYFEESDDNDSEVVDDTDDDLNEEEDSDFDDYLNEEEDSEFDDDLEEDDDSEFDDDLEEEDSESDDEEEEEDSESDDEEEEEDSESDDEEEDLE